jgi:pyruvate/2-oxoglutarate dehydrogenase complex dihydrolipoamide acyltransferase (E2) component
MPTQVEIVVPELGLDPSHTLVVSTWLAEVGDEVFNEDRVVELLLDGATFDLAAPATGMLTEVLAYPEDPVQPGQVLGIIETPDPLDDEPSDDGADAAPDGE